VTSAANDWGGLVGFIVGDEASALEAVFKLLEGGGLGDRNRLDFFVLVVMESQTKRTATTRL